MTFFASYFWLLGQAKNLPAMGKLTLTDVQKDYNAEYPSAEAVKIYDYGEISVEPRATLLTKFYHYERIKILKKEGLDYANVSFRLREGVIRSVEAYTYNIENGELVKQKMKKDAYFTEKEKDYFTVKFTLPTVKEGAIIEYEYIYESEYIFQLPEWYFQASIPCIESELHTIFPEMLRYVILSQSFYPIAASKESRTTSAGITYLENAMVKKNIPAYKKEKFIKNEKDCYDKMAFQLSEIVYPGELPKPILKTWDKFCEEILERDGFGGYYRKNSAAAVVLKDVVSDTMNVYRKVKAIYDYARHFYVWNGENAVVAEHSYENVLKSSKGTSAEINLALLTLLRTAGINAHPIILAKRSFGTVVKQYPIISCFNHVMVRVQIDGKDYFLDATDPFRAMEMLPFQALNGEGLLILDDGKSKWLPLNCTHKNNKIVTINATLSPDGKIAGNLMTNVSGYEALSVCKRYKDKAAEIVIDEKLAEKAGEKQLLASEIKFEGIDNFEKSLSGKMKFETSDYVQVSDDRLYLNPLIDFEVQNMDNLFHFRIAENPFTAENRLYPIDLGFPSDESYTFSLKLPEGYKVEEMPQNVKFVLPDKSASLDYMVSNKDNLLKITSRMSFSRSVFDAEEYELLKAFFAKVVEKHNEVVVLKRE